MASWDPTPTTGYWAGESKTSGTNGDNYGHGSDYNDNNFNDKSAGAGGDDGCRNCHAPGHFARDCPEERKAPNSGECYNCGEVGHNKSDCPNPKVGGLTGECFNCGETGHNKVDCPNPKIDRPFTGTCHFCEAEGHRASECPEKPAEKCRNCLQEGHKAAECESNRLLDRSTVADMDTVSAWNLLKQAAADKEIIEFQEALKIYAKRDVDLTYEKLEHKLRESGVGVYVIALDKEISKSMTNINLQGKPGCKYTIGFFFKATATRPMMKEFWPATPAENLERLKDAGETMDNTVPLCRNCNELGHVAKDCGQEKAAPNETVGIVCSNCSESGHRVRDCPKERAPRGGDCRNCNQPGHKASDCPEERSAANVECRRCGEVGHFSKECPSNEGGGGGGGGCRNCGEEGHFAKDCDKPKNPANMKCRNCDETGHAARDCEKPKDWSRVKCNNCGEFGHTVKRCTKPVPEPDNSYEAEDNTGGHDNSGGTAAWDTTGVSKNSAGGW